MACTPCRKRKARCDGLRPSCSTCTRLNKVCVYVQLAARRGPKRRNVKELEDRIALMEAQLNHTGPKDVFSSDAAISFGNVQPSSEMAGDGFLQLVEPLTSIDNVSPASLPQSDLDTGQVTISNTSENYIDPTSYTPSADYQSAELVGLGRCGNLPNETIIHDLTKIYFSDIHPWLPIIHEGRYHTSLRLNASHKPALCLQYAMWALAAKYCEKFSHLAECFHQRSRLYIEEDELMDHESSFLTVSHVQCWCLLAFYEAADMKLTRAWMNTRRAIALSQLLRLHVLDRPPPSVAQLLPESRDFAEKEERRRTFWAVFCLEYWAGSGTGNPLASREEDVFTNLPSSDDAFVLNLSEPTQTLQDALENGLNPSSSPFTAYVIQSCILKRNVEHANNVTNDVHGSECQKKRFWEQHQRLDNLISIVFMSVSGTLRLSGATPDPLLIKFVTGMHAFTLSLHQTAIRYAQKYGADESQIARSTTRCQQKAEEIVDVMRSVAHVDCKKMHPFTSSCLYSAASVFLQSYKSGHEVQTNLENLRFTMKSLRLFARHWKTANLFVTQLSDDIECEGIDLHESAHPTDVPRFDSVHYFGHRKIGSVT